MAKERNWRLDNLRAFLIILVVVGHLTEILSYPQSDFVYRFIYAFHMPGFALLSGLCWNGAKEGRILKRLLYPYLIFQTLYQIFHYFVFGGDLVLQYTTPYWVMWYLMALMGWELMAAALPLSKCWSGLAVVAGTLIAALLAGQDTAIGYFLSLSRMLVLFPFFVAGVWLNRHTAALMAAPARWWLKLAAAIGFLLCAGIVWHWRETLQPAWLFHRGSYTADAYTPLIRLGLLLLAAVLLASLLILIPNRRFEPISWLGQNTMPVFLIHGFLMRWISARGLFQSVPYNWRGLLVVGLALAISFVLSSPPVVWLTRPLMRWPFERKSGRRHAVH